MSKHEPTLFIDSGLANGPRGWQRGTVVAGTLTTVRARFDAWHGDVQPTVGTELLVYGQREPGGVLLEQRARIARLESNSAGALTIEFQHLSEPVPFDRRAVDRVKCPERGFFADVDDDIGCRVLDFGATGFSIVSRQRHVPGALAELTLHFEGEVLVGRGAVTSATSGPDGSTRFGIHVLSMPGSGLTAGMRRVAERLKESTRAVSASH